MTRRAPADRRTTLSPDVGSRRARTLPALVVAAAVAVITASCSESPSQTDTGGQSSPAAGGAVAGGSGDRRQQAVKFAECIRANGVADFPDPDAAGEFIYGVSVSPDVFTKAVEACKDLQPPGSLSVDRTAEEQSAGLEFAQCMRENGVADFPDPVDGEPLINTYKIPSTERQGGMAILNAAIDSCRAMFEQAASEQ